MAITGSFECQHDKTAASLMENGVEIANMESTDCRRPALSDALILVAATAICLLVSRYGLINWLYVLVGGFDKQVWASRTLDLSWHWGSLILRHTQPIAAIFTLAVLVLSIWRPSEPDSRRVPHAVA
jgi:hypothetical protein